MTNNIFKISFLKVLKNIILNLLTILCISWLKLQKLNISDLVYSAADSSLEHWAINVSTHFAILRIPLQS
jgi:hypothetical protein